MRARLMRRMKVRLSRTRGTASTSSSARSKAIRACVIAARSTLHVISKPFTVLGSILSNVTGLNRLSAMKLSSLSLAAVLLLVGGLGQREAEALYSIDDPELPGYVISKESFIQKVSLGTGNAKQVTKYTVESGDSLGSIAAEFGITVNTIKRSNNLTSETISPGLELNLYNQNGLVHIVGKNDTIEKIAKKYTANEELITWYNDLSEDAVIHAGDEIFVVAGIHPSDIQRDRAVRDGRSGGRYVPAGPNAPASGGAGLQWPVFGTTYMRGWAGGHTGLDLAAKKGHPVYAAADGVVVKAYDGGYGGGYGTHIIIDHGNGLQTLYAHLSGLSVTVGQAVSQGQNIAPMGSTGRSTGPHLHFEVIDNGVKRNPAPYLP